MVVKGNFAERICSDRPASRSGGAGRCGWGRGRKRERKIAGETKQFVCTREMWARQHYVLPAPFAFRFTLMRRGMEWEDASPREPASFSVKELRARPLNQFHQRDGTGAPQVRGQSTMIANWSAPLKNNVSRDERETLTGEKLED